jgi:CHRD domain
MRKTIVLTALTLAIGAGVAFAHNNRRTIREFLTGVQEVPVVSTTGSGTFRAEISKDGDEIEYTLSFRNLEASVRMAHIHIAPEQNTGPIVLWLCQTAAFPAPAGTNSPQCFNALAGESPRTNTVSGVLRASDVVPQLTNGIAANELDEVLALIRAGKSYVNVHSDMSPGGEIRSQIGNHDHDDRR